MTIMIIANRFSFTAIKWGFYFIDDMYFSAICIFSRDIRFIFIFSKIRISSVPHFMP